MAGGGQRHQLQISGPRGHKLPTALLSRALALSQQLVDVRHHFKGVGDVEDVGFAAGPAAIGVEADGAAFVDEAPADGVRFLAMTARAQALGVAGG